MTTEQKQALLDAWLKIAKDMGAGAVDRAHVAATIIEGVIFRHARDHDDAMEGVAGISKDMRRNLAARYADA